MKTTLAEAPETFRAQLAARLAAPTLLDPRAIDGVLALPFRALAEDGEGGASTGYTLEQDVAVVSIDGPIAQRAWSCWMFSGDGYDAIEQRVRAALSDERVRALVLRIDSPGGEVAGCAVCADAIRSAADAAGKPVVSYVGELAASAAYWLASAADKIVTPASGMLGSVGVIATRIEHAPRADRKVRVITSGARKADGHPEIPMSDEELAATQAEVNYLADLFAGAVGARRGMAAQAVRALEAAVFVGEQAVSAGLADRVGNLSSAVAYARELATTKRRRKTMNAINRALGIAEDSNEAVAVATVEGLRAKAAKADELEAKLATIEAKQLEADRAAALAEGDAKGVFTPAVRALYAERSAAEIRAFVSVAPRVIAAQETGKPGPKPPQGPETGAKRFEELSPMERAALHQSNPEAYAALRADAEKRGAF